jgi:WD40 repeat protein
MADTLEPKAEKQSAHSGPILSVGFSPNGTKIISGGYDQALKVWKIRPFDESEWEAVEPDEDSDIEWTKKSDAEDGFWQYAGEKLPSSVLEQIRSPLQSGTELSAHKVWAAGACFFALLPY